MIAAPVLLIPPTVPLSEILNGVPVSSRAWQNMAHLANYCAGRGSSQIPAYYPGNTITAGSSGTYRYRFAGTQNTLSRVWFVRVRSASSTQDTEITITVDSQTAVGIFDDARDQRALTLVETITTPADTGTMSLQIDVTSGVANAIVESIACYDIPRTELELGASPADNAVHTDSVRAGAPIYDEDAAGSGGTRSVQGLIDAYPFYASTTDNPYPHRNQWQWAVPVADAIAETSGTYTTISHMNLQYLVKKRQVIESVNRATFYAYAKVDSGSANVKFRSQGAIDLVALTITSTTGAWVSSEYTSFACEDLAEDDGRADISGSPGWTGIEVQARVTTATQVDIEALALVQEA